MYSIATFSLFKAELLDSESLFHANCLRNSFGQRSIHSPTKPALISIQPLVFRNSFKPSPLCAELDCSYNPRAPSSTCSTTTSLSIQTSLFKLLSEKIMFCLLGSFILIGCFDRRVALALPSVTSDSTLEESTDALKEKSEDEEMYEKILEKDPRNVEALKVTLFKKIRMRKSKEAVKYVESLIDAEPNEVEWRLLLALCYETMGHLSTAKRLFREILEQRPLLIRALHGLAIVMHKKHEGPAVFEMLNEALELAYREKRVTEERNIRILIAQMHVAKGDLEEGLKRFQELVDEDPRDFRPYLCQNDIRLAAGNDNFFWLWSLNIIKI
ncbi:protein SLOW GREEN 1, chloroplastic isoform X2 [Prosopis cineraria]|uniref:protein SLOW GREEN 1, chloroplastic isoform X2 n=1 Tax=Prosopis cineraria TaxID=364024 RepID=UPI00240F6AFC|nr:protein SLOW GREEN 1, chloroplastic isoform X2 [Prosopis cineraria]